MSVGVQARAPCGRVTQRCHNRNPRWEAGLGIANDVTHRKRAEDFEDFEKVIELSSASGETVGFRLLAEARPVALWRVPHVLRGCRWKNQNRKNVHLSVYVEEPLNSKVIKSFVPELRSRKCFCVSGFPCSMYICYEHSVYVSQIAVSGYGTLGTI